MSMFRWVRLVFGLLVVSLLLGMVSIGHTQSGGSVEFSLVPPVRLVKVGDVVDVTIRMDSPQDPVVAAQVYLNFDPTVLQVVDNSLTPGSLFATNGWIVLQNQVDNAVGTIGFAGGKSPASGGLDATGLVKFASFQFTVLDLVSDSVVTFSSVAPRQTKAVSGILDVTGTLGVMRLSLNEGTSPSVGFVSLGSVSAPVGSFVSLPVLLDTGGVEATGVQFNLEYDPSLLGKPSLVRGSSLPQGWDSPFSSSQPGELKFASADLTAFDQAPINGQIAEVTFELSTSAVVGTVVPVSIPLGQVQDTFGTQFAIQLTPGSVTVTEPSGLSPEEVESRILDLESRLATLEGMIQSVPPTGVPPVVPTGWIDDGLPTGAIPGGLPWNWVSTNPSPFSGSLVHKSDLSPGIHERYFTRASETLVVGPGESLFAYVFLDPATPPRELMLQWTDGSWEHRAYWGENLIPWGANNTTGRHSMGSLPSLGEWVKLVIPARDVGLEGSTISGMAFSLYGGSASLDLVGKE